MSKVSDLFVALNTFNNTQMNIMPIFNNVHSIYFVRHAPTPVNITGDMMENYNKEGAILPFDVNQWQSIVGCKIDWNNVKEIWTSDSLRTNQTAQKINKNNSKIIVEPLLNEFDCSGIGTKKFWEISEDEFNELTHIDGKKCRLQIMELLDKAIDYVKAENKDLICVTHGMFIRLLYTCLTNKGDHTMYDIINSKTFKFSNLDMLMTKVTNDIQFDNIFYYKES